jgi:hypothetical protein
MPMTRPPESLAWCACRRIVAGAPFLHRGLGLLHFGGRTFASRKTLQINNSRVIHKDFCIPLWTPLKNL